jgi:hypothetical protein
VSDLIVPSDRHTGTFQELKPHAGIAFTRRFTPQLVNEHLLKITYCLSNDVSGISRDGMKPGGLKIQRALGILSSKILLLLMTGLFLKSISCF